jgi:hypothetical protein
MMMFREVGADKKRRIFRPHSAAGGVSRLSAEQRKRKDMQARLIRHIARTIHLFLVGLQQQTLFPSVQKHK